MRLHVGLGLWSAVLLAVAPSMVHAASEKVIAKGVATIEGGDQAKAREQALRNAQRNAVEQVLGALIESKFSAEQKESIKNGDSTFSSNVEDQVYAKSQGFIAKQKVLTEKVVGNTLEIMLEAEVQRQSLEAELGHLESVLAAQGFPTIAVLLAERYAAQGQAPRAVVTQAPAMIEDLLLQKGLRLLGKEELATFKSGQDLSAVVADSAKAARVAIDAKADVAIVGSVETAYLSFNEGGDQLYYVSATLNLRAIAAQGGQLASISQSSRGVGVSEDTARDNAVKSIAPKAANLLVESLIRAWQQQQTRGPIVLEALTPRIGLAKKLEAVSVEFMPKKPRQFWRLPAGEDAIVLVDGPMTLAIDLITMGPAPTGANGALQVSIDASQEGRWAFTTTKAKRPLRVQKDFVSAPLRKQMEIGPGRHQINLRTDNGGVAMDFVEAKATVRNLLLKLEASEPLPAIPLLPVDEPVVSQPPTPSPAVAAPVANVVAPAPAAPKKAEVVERQAKPKDGSVSAATLALAETLQQALKELGRVEPFHRVAVPAFKQTGDFDGDKMGELVADLLSVELAQREPFVVVERDRLAQVMKEHRLADLGAVDTAYAAEFGKMLGAQSILMGTVGEAGPSVIVTVRQVDVETGQALTAAKVEFERAGLIALSSDMIETRSKSGAMLRSIVLPGWGQFYNKQSVKGASVLGASLATLGATAYYFSSGLSAQSRYESNRPDTVDDRKVANSKFRTTNVLLIAYGVLWGLNCLDAYLNGYEEVTP